MEITGYDYVFYSNKSIFDLESTIIEEVKMMWPDLVWRYVPTNEENELWIFFAKDIKMEEEDIGYSLNKDGEGVFSIIGNKKSSIDSITTFMKSDNKIDFEARFLLNEIRQYTLILPEEIENNDFAKKIYDVFVAILASGMEKSKEEYIHKPVQYYIGRS